MDRLSEVKRQINILESDNKLGKISYTKVVEETNIPQSKSDEKRLQIDPVNFMELKKFVNKYREKLVIKSENQMTMVDKLEGKKAKNSDKIDFDYQNFKDSCLSNTLSQKWDGKEVQKIIQKLKRNLLNNFDLTK